MQLKFIGHSNTLCVRAIRAITNHAPIEEYHFRFFLRESFACLYREYSIKSRNYILYNCRSFNKYWNPNGEFLQNFITFLSLIQRLSSSIKELFNGVINVFFYLIQYSVIYYILFFPFFLFISFSFFSCYLSSYIVTIIVYYHTLCNKLLISKKRQVCQALYLSRFDFILKHVSETKIKKTEGLSKRPDWKVGIETNNKN